MKLRDFWKSWEFLSLPIVLWLLFSLPLPEFIRLSSIVLNAYVLSRAIYKISRGLTYSAGFSSEGYAYLLNLGLLGYGRFSGDFPDFGYFVVGAYTCFALSRGLTKKLRDSKTTMLMR